MGGRAADRRAARPGRAGARPVAAVRRDGGVDPAARRRSGGGRVRRLRRGALPCRRQTSVRAIARGSCAAAARLPAVAASATLAAHRRVVREALGHADAIRAELDAMAMPNRLLDGRGGRRAAVRPLRTRPGRPRARPAAARGASAELDAASTRPRRASAAHAAARADRAARRSTSPPTPATRSIERDLEQTIYAANTADATYFGWLMRAMMTCRQPFAMSVFVHALDRRRERQRLKLRYRRTLRASTASAESQGPRAGLRPLPAPRPSSSSCWPRCPATTAPSIFGVSIYQSIRVARPGARRRGAARGGRRRRPSTSPRRPTAASTSGKFQQAELWRSTLPLGRDVAGRSRQYATRNVGDSTPLLGVAVGSPHGHPVRVHRAGPDARAVRTRTTARTPTTCAWSPAARAPARRCCATRCWRALIAHGARGFVIDRAGHYRVLSRAARRRAAHRHRRRRRASSRSTRGTSPIHRQVSAREGRLPARRCTRR